MAAEGIRRLLARYSTGEITEEERKELFLAAMDDQELFDDLAAEDAVRDALALPGATARIAQALAPKSKRRWLPYGILAATPLLALAAFLVFRQPPTPPTNEIAAIPAAPPQAQPAPEPAAQPVRKPAPVKREARRVDQEPKLMAERGPAAPEAAVGPGLYRIDEGGNRIPVADGAGVPAGTLMVVRTPAVAAGTAKLTEAASPRVLASAPVAAGDMAELSFTVPEREPGSVLDLVVTFGSASGNAAGAISAMRASEEPARAKADLAVPAPSVRFKIRVQ